jgi:hypothetical protein
VENNPRLSLPRKVRLLAKVERLGLRLQNTIFLTPGAMVRALLLFLLPLAMVALPWMVRNALLTGNPVFGLRGQELWMATIVYPGLLAYRLPPQSLAANRQVLGATCVKLVTGVTTGLTSFTQFPASWLLLCLAPALFAPCADAAATIMRRVTLWCMAGLFAGCLLFAFDPALLMAVLPGLLVFGAGYLVERAREVELTPRAIATALAALAIVLGYPLLTRCVFPPASKSGRPAEAARSLAHLSRHDEFCLSDVPWMVAWYGDRPSLWLPAEDAQVAQLRKKFATMRWLFLTEATRNYSPEWQMAYNSFLSWNLAVAQARQKGTSIPPAPSITPNQYPLAQALNGFTAVEPAPRMEKAAVIATVPVARTARWEGATR